MKFKFFILFLFVKTTLNAQILRGIIQTDKGEKVWAAAVQWSDNSATVLTDSLGRFQIPKSKKPAQLIVTHVGFSRTIFTMASNDNNLKLIIKQDKELKTVEVKGQRADNAIATLNPYLVEKISSNELKKAPCCNLSESFETNGTVDVVYSDALTGAKEIQMLGLRGLYTQLLVENRPDFYGIAAPYALEYLAGTWIEGIDINKGVGSVKNGYQSITGQINTELEKPGKGKRLFFNTFWESTGRLETNLQTNHKLSEQLYTGLLLHGDWMNKTIDKNKDGFRDMPDKKQLNGLYRLFYNSEKIHAQFNFQAISEKRENGTFLENSIPFLITTNTHRFSAFGKLAYLGFNKPYLQLGSQWAATYHGMNAQYGSNGYLGKQASLYGNVIYSTILFNTDHKINVGSSFQFDNYDEYLNENDLSRREIVTGVFTEYTYAHQKLKQAYSDWTVIGGLRSDFHNLYGLLVSPRLNVKYAFNEKQAMRFVLGRGVRVANPIAENISYLATNRTINIASNLKPEDAWNVGVSYVMPLKINDYEGHLSIDAYRTQFKNQIIRDLEADYKTIHFYNLEGQSYANSFLITLFSEIFEGLDFKLAYKFSDVKSTYSGVLRQTPLIAKNRGLVSFDFHTENHVWMLNFTTQIVGKQRLIDRSFLPPQYQTGVTDFSPVYTIFNMSLNRKFKFFEVYGGAENLTNYVQTKPIIAAENPQSIYFDGTQIYAPLVGRRFYAGIRLSIP